MARFSLAILCSYSSSVKLSEAKYNFITLETLANYNEAYKKKRLNNSYNSFFLKENVRYAVWTCRDPISLILGAR